MHTQSSWTANKWQIKQVSVDGLRLTKNSKNILNVLRYTSLRVYMKFLFFFCRCACLYIISLYVVYKYVLNICVNANIIGGRIDWLWLTLPLTFAPPPLSISFPNLSVYLSLYILYIWTERRVLAFCFHYRITAIEIHLTQRETKLRTWCSKWVIDPPACRRDPAAAALQLRFHLLRRHHFRSSYSCADGCAASLGSGWAADCWPSTRGRPRSSERGAACCICCPAAPSGRWARWRTLRVAWGCPCPCPCPSPRPAAARGPVWWANVKCCSSADPTIANCCWPPSRSTSR